MEKENKKYDLDETNRRRLNDILGKALSIATVLYTEDEKKRVDQKTLMAIIRNAGLIRSIACDIAHGLGLEVLEIEDGD